LEASSCDIYDVAEQLDPVADENTAYYLQVLLGEAYAVFHHIHKLLV
jgi:hypothetical protein